VTWSQAPGVKIRSESFASSRITLGPERNRALGAPSVRVTENLPNLSGPRWTRTTCLRVTRPDSVVQTQFRTWVP